MSSDTAAIRTAQIEESDDGGSVDAGAFNLRGAGKLLVASGTGKFALALFALMIGISIYVVATYPLRFGTERWSNPISWADNPKTAPPFWTTWLGRDGFEHRTLTKADPDAATQRGAAEVRDYAFGFSVDSDAAPTFLSLTLTGVTFSARAPVVIADLTRPDGGRIRLLNLAVPAPRAGETAPYRRYYDVPERQLLTQQETAVTALEQWFAQQYPGAASPDLASNLADALFAVPAADGSGALTTLAGDYTVTVQVLVADPNDQVAPVKLVTGGTVYGWMGTDAIGRDLWVGLLYGFPVGLLIATLASLLSTIIGAALGVISGYAGGTTDAVIQRLCDIISNVPTLPLLIFLVFVLG